MAKKLFLFSLLGAYAIQIMLFFSRHQFGREEVIVLSIALLAEGIAVGFFFWKNKEVLNEVTVEPSEKNWQIFVGTFKRKKSKEHSKDA